MKTASQEKPSIVPDTQASTRRASSIKHQPRSNRFYFDVGIGSVMLSGPDTGGAYCLIEASLAPGIGVPRHMHTREDEAYYVLSEELEVIVEGKIFVLKAGDCLMAPRDIPHQIRNSGNAENHYLLIFSPSGLDEFLMATALRAPDNAAAPTEQQRQADDPSIAIRNVHKLATEYGIVFG
jgi:mannose-6-phosphate isomerase-like protein (cupin superfamily)